MNKWNEILKSKDIPERLKDLIVKFFIPYQIDPIKFLVNSDATSDPHRYIMYRDQEMFSETLQKFQEDLTLKAVAYPDWFYCAFPDVAMWAIRDGGIRVVSDELLSINELTTYLNGDSLKDKYLKIIIDLYKIRHKLECAIESKSTFDKN